MHQIMEEARTALAVAIPGVRGAIAISVNDFSNSNGGYFTPHAGHRLGSAADTTFPGFSARDAASARNLALVLNEVHRIALTHGWSLQVAHAAYTPAFAAELRNTTIAGRNGADVVTNLSDHKTWFHVQLRPAQ